MKNVNSDGSCIQKIDRKIACNYNHDGTYRVHPCRQYKTADRLSRHLSAVLRKIREVIGNSLASKRTLLRSASELA